MTSGQDQRCFGRDPNCAHVHMYLERCGGTGGRRISISSVLFVEAVVGGSRFRRRVLICIGVVVADGDRYVAEQYGPPSRLLAPNLAHEGTTSNTLVSFFKFICRGYIFQDVLQDFQRNEDLASIASSHLATLSIPASLNPSAPPSSNAVNGGSSPSGTSPGVSVHTDPFETGTSGAMGLRPINFPFQAVVVALGGILAGAVLI